MDPLTPNTSAFLSYLAASAADPTTNSPVKPTSLPPSAFFPMPVPGRDTPELTPESSTKDTSVSPDAQARQFVPSDSEGEASGTKPSARRQSSGGANHKRKAGHGHTVQQESDDDEDFDSEAPSGHEDKRQHAAKASGKKGGRKSVGGEDGKTGGKENKAARRKEQNRAAQKAFRERREAKVKDLEDKLAELEAKSFGVNVENENLRGILKRLQDENIALKQTAFTFSMPSNGSKGASGTATPTTTANNVNTTYQPQAAKPLTPPQSVDGSVSRQDSREAGTQPQLHRAPSSQADTPESLQSINSRSASMSEASQPKQHPTFDTTQTFNSFALGGGPKNATTWGSSNYPQISPESLSTFSRSDSGISPGSSSSNNKSDIEALWASFYPQGVSGRPGSVQGQPAKQPTPAAQNSTPGQVGAPSAQDTFFSNFFSAGAGGVNQQASAGNQSSAANQDAAEQLRLQQISQFKTGWTPFVNVSNPMDRMAFRDTSNPVAQEPAPLPPSLQDNKAADNNDIDWSKFAGNDDMDFLNSLLGVNNNSSADANASYSADDEFTASLNALLQSTNNNSPSGAFNFPGMPNAFSPTNYLNMSPSPLQAMSSSQSPSSAHNSASNSASPASVSSTNPSSITSGNEAPYASGGFGTFGPPKKPSEVVHVLDENGHIVKPSDLWVKMGMTQQDNVTSLVIDDLCDQMRAKATCKDGTHYLAFDDAALMFQRHPDGKFNIPPKDITPPIAK